MGNAEEKILKAIGWIVTILAITMWLWIIISYFDIVAHNIESRHGYGGYLEWNFFTAMEDLIRG